jgi:hypothetical protein
MSRPVPKRAEPGFNALEAIVFRELLAVELEKALGSENVAIPFNRAMAVREKHGAFLRAPSGGQG